VANPEPNKPNPMLDHLMIVATEEGNGGRGREGEGGGVYCTRQGESGRGRVPWPQCPMPPFPRFPIYSFPTFTSTSPGATESLPSPSLHPSNPTSKNPHHGEAPVQPSTSWRVCREKGGLLPANRTNGANDPTEILLVAEVHVRAPTRAAGVCVSGSVLDYRGELAAWREGRLPG
jgi:hypothetical protein